MVMLMTGSIYYYAKNTINAVCANITWFVKKTDPVIKKIIPITTTALATYCRLSYGIFVGLGWISYYLTSYLTKPKQVSHLKDNEYYFIQEIIKELNAKTPKKRSEISQKFHKKFPSEHWSREPFSDYFISRVAEFSDEVFSKHSQNDIFCLGQTPAWLALFPKIKSKGEQIHSIAFSSGWYSLLDIQGQELVLCNRKDTPPGARCISENEKINPKTKLIFNKDRAPNRAQTIAYRKYLVQKGLSPKLILDKDKPTVIMDYVQSGAGLKSFLNFLMVWAEEESISPQKLKAKLIVHFITHFSDFSFFGGAKNFKRYLDNNFEGYRCVSTSISSYEKDPCRVLTELMNKCKDDEHRLIKKNPCRNWCEQSGTYFKNNKENIRLIINQIYRFEKEPNMLSSLF
jgi:hypothetical protein